MDTLPPLHPAVAQSILAIVPVAGDWRAVFVENDATPVTRAVLCWALVRHANDDRGATYVTAVVPETRAGWTSGTALASEVESFVGIAAPGEDPAEILAARRHAEMMESVMPMAWERAGRTDAPESEVRECADAISGSASGAIEERR
jgi:hypothetical protein